MGITFHSSLATVLQQQPLVILFHLKKNFQQVSLMAKRPQTQNGNNELINISKALLKLHAHSQAKNILMSVQL